MGDVINMRPGGEPAPQDPDAGEFICQHLHIYNVTSASCGICGPLARQAS